MFQRPAILLFLRSIGNIGPTGLDNFLDAATMARREPPMRIQENDSNYVNNRLRLNHLGLLAWLTLALASVAPLPAQTQPAPESDAARERFLREAEIGRVKTLGEGITMSLMLTMEKDGITHEAHAQAIDERKAVHRGNFKTEVNFVDSYKYNIAAYKLSRLLGIPNVPVSVERRVRGERSAVTWWVDDVLFTEKTRHLKKKPIGDRAKWNRQIYILRVFDQLIYNTDRNLGNLLIDKHWRLWFIDHTRAFRPSKDLLLEKQLLRIDRLLLQRLKELDEATLRAEIGAYVEENRIRGLLARRDRIVAFFENKIAKTSEAAVLYDYLSTMEDEDRAAK
jgi:hypothetical protein